MAQTTAGKAARRQIPLTADCQAAAEFGWPRAHERCRGNGPLHIAGFRAPALPAQPCGCPCHTPNGGTR